MQGAAMVPDISLYGMCSYRCKCTVYTLCLYGDTVHLLQGAAMALGALLADTEDGG
jgi:hypothetical protein